MRTTESLDALTAKKATEFADQVKAAAMADKEEEIRIEAEPNSPPESGTLYVCMDGAGSETL